MYRKHLNIEKKMLNHCKFGIDIDKCTFYCRCIYSPDRMNVVNSLFYKNPFIQKFKIHILYDTYM